MNMRVKSHAKRNIGGASGGPEDLPAVFGDSVRSPTED